MTMSAPQCLDEGPLAWALCLQGKTGAVKAEATYNHAAGASMAQEVIVYSNVGCGPCHQAMEYFSQTGVPFIEKNVARAPGVMQTLMRMGLRLLPVLATDDQCLSWFKSQGD